MRRVLIIRPLEDGLSLAQALQERGIDVSLHPLFEPHFFEIPSLGRPQALIITSKNAIRAMEHYHNLKKVPLYVVGDQTAEFAKSKGFLSVESASGTSKDLLQLIVKKGVPNKGRLWYLSGATVKKDIVFYLQARGFDAKRQIVYGIQNPENLPEPLHSEILEKKISHVMFFSPHTTQIFGTLLKECGLLEACHHIEALCLSKDVGKEAEKQSWKQIWVSAHPTQHSLIRYFDEKKVQS